ncbi:MAG: hypothetical protein JSS28_12375 [Proteobacteria bacterium]|nr:hypothetical protein [Pseudomonadota bacterium]
MLAAAALAVAGCAGMVRKDEDASVIREKAVQRWDYLIAKKADKAYDFLSPGYRTTITRENYAAGMNNRPVTWEAVQFADQNCDADLCTVHLKLKYKVLVNLHGIRNIQGDSPLTERWIKESGRWYFLPDSRYKAPAVKE